MTTHPKPSYRRILLKLSGEALLGKQDYGVDQLESLQGADTIGYRSTLPAYRVNKTIQQGRMFEA